MPLVPQVQNELDSFLDVAIREESDVNPLIHHAQRRNNNSAEIEDDDSRSQGSSSIFSIGARQKTNTKQTNNNDSLSKFNSSMTSLKSVNTVGSDEVDDNLTAGGGDEASLGCIWMESSTTQQQRQEEEHASTARLEEELTKLKFELAEARSQADWYRLQHRQLLMEFEDLQAFCLQLQKGNTQQQQQQQSQQRPHWFPQRAVSKRRWKQPYASSPPATPPFRKPLHNQQQRRRRRRGPPSPTATTTSDPLSKRDRRPAAKQKGGSKGSGPALPLDDDETLSSTLGGVEDASCGSPALLHHDLSSRWLTMEGDDDDDDDNNNSCAGSASCLTDPLEWSARSDPTELFGKGKRQLYDPQNDSDCSDDDDEDEKETVPHRSRVGRVSKQQQQQQQGTKRGDRSRVGREASVPETPRARGGGRERTRRDNRPTVGAKSRSWKPSSTTTTGAARSKSRNDDKIFFKSRSLRHLPSSETVDSTSSPPPEADNRRSQSPWRARTQQFGSSSSEDEATPEDVSPASEICTEVVIHPRKSFGSYVDQTQERHLRAHNTAMQQRFSVGDGSISVLTPNTAVTVSSPPPPPPTVIGETARHRNSGRRRSSLIFEDLNVNSDEEYDKKEHYAEISVTSTEPAAAAVENTTTSSWWCKFNPTKRVHNNTSRDAPTERAAENNIHLTDISEGSN